MSSTAHPDADNEKYVRSILGDDYLSPDDSVKVYGLNYTGFQLSHLTETLPNTETLAWLRSNGFLLVATPPIDMDLLYIYDLDRHKFLGQLLNNYQQPNLEERCSWSLDHSAPGDIVRAGEWLMVRKEPYSNSLGLPDMPWEEQKSLLTDVEHVPNAPEMAHCVYVYYKMRGVCMLRGVGVKTSSINKNGQRVLIGSCNITGNLQVRAILENWGGSNIGIASARRNLQVLKA